MALWRCGDTRNARDVGFNETGSVTWAACPDCGKERWVRKGKTATRCHMCNAKNHFAIASQKNWKNYQGGRKSGGYWQVSLNPSDFFSPMIDANGYIMEHRLVMAKHLGRCLHRWERVHHKNGIKDDNRIENLELTENIGNHARQHSKGYQDGYLKGLLDGHGKAINELQIRVTLLEAENELLKSQMIDGGVKCP